MYECMEIHIEKYGDRNLSIMYFRPSSLLNVNTSGLLLVVYAERVLFISRYEPGIHHDIIEIVSLGEEAVHVLCK